MICLAALLFCGCKREKTVFHIYFRDSLDVGPMPLVNTPYEYISGPGETKSETEFHVFDTRKGLVETATPYSVCITTLMPDSAIFSLKTIEVYLQGEGLDPLLVVPETNVPDSMIPHYAAPYFNFCVETLPVEAKKHISKETYQAIVKFTVDEPLNFTTSFWLDFAFEVNAKEFRH